jgi:DNA-binding transcriptional MerR regulator
MATAPKKPPTETPINPLNQLGRTDAARFLGVSLATIKRFEKEGILTPTKDDKGVHRYDIGELEAYRAEKNGMPSPEVEKMVATIDSAASQANKASQHVERVLNIVLDPSESLLEMYKEECAALREQCAKLTTENLTMLAELRVILKEQRQEDIDERELERTAKRKDMAIGMVRDAIPLIVSQLTGNKAAGGVVKMVRSFTPEQLSILGASGLLTPDQLKDLTILLTEEQRSALSKQPDTSEEESQSD